MYKFARDLQFYIFGSFLSCSQKYGFQWHQWNKDFVPLHPGLRAEKWQSFTISFSMQKKAPDWKSTPPPAVANISYAYLNERFEQLDMVQTHQVSIFIFFFQFILGGYNIIYDGQALNNQSKYIQNLTKEFCGALDNCSKRVENV